VKDIVKHRRKMERIELGLEKEDKKEKKSRKEEKKFGTLFKGGKKEEGEEEEGEEGGVKLKEGTDEYWNAERAKLGLAPLKAK